MCFLFKIQSDEEEADEKPAEVKTEKAPKSDAESEADDEEEEEEEESAAGDKDDAMNSEGMRTFGAHVSISLKIVAGPMLVSECHVEHSMLPYKRSNMHW